MTENGRQNGELAGDSRLILELAAGATVRDASVAAGMGETTAYRRLREADFRSRVVETRAALTAAVLLRTVDLSTRALNALGELLEDDNPHVRLGAARTVLTVGALFGEKAELAQRLQALEDTLKARR